MKASPAYSHPSQPWDGFAVRRRVFVVGPLAFASGTLVQSGYEVRNS